ncbi:MAG: hypothetical protein IJ410_01325 [Oscillospiraceae bacterium]|nr:hypothetical protein [Oscillospiraceae bacterium]
MIYILFGMAIAALITASGGYTSLVVEGAFLNTAMSGGTYMILMGIVTIGWLPALVTVLISKQIYVNLPGGKLIPAAILFVFMVFSRYCTKGNKPKIRQIR